MLCSHFSFVCAAGVDLTGKGIKKHLTVPSHLNIDNSARILDSFDHLQLPYKDMFFSCNALYSYLFLVPVKWAIINKLHYSTIFIKLFPKISDNLLKVLLFSETDQCQNIHKIRNFFTVGCCVKTDLCLRPSRLRFLHTPYSLAMLSAASWKMSRRLVNIQAPRKLMIEFHPCMTL